jgi:hypothetical protein
MRLGIYKKVVKILKKELTKEEFDKFSVALDGDADEEFSELIERINAKLNPENYGVLGGEAKVLTEEFFLGLKLPKKSIVRKMSPEEETEQEEDHKKILSVLKVQAPNV